MLAAIQVQAAQYRWPSKDGARCRRPSAGSPVQRTRCGQPGGGGPVQSVQCWQHGADCQVQELKCWRPNADGPVQAARCRQPGTGDPVLEAQCWRHSAGGPVLDVQCWLHGAGGLMQMAMQAAQNTNYATKYIFEDVQKGQCQKDSRWRTVEEGQQGRGSEGETVQ